MKKSVMIIAAAAMLAVVPVAAFADTQVNVSATVKPVPQASMAVNFDGMSFVGTVGDAAVAPNYSKAGGAGQNSYHVNAHSNYTVLVSGWDFNTVFNPMDPMHPTQGFSGQRLSVSNPTTGTFTSLQNMPTVLDSGAGQNLNVDKTVNFKLDLRPWVMDPQTNMPLYNDMTPLDTINAETNFFNTVTFSFTAM